MKQIMLLFLIMLVISGCAQGELTKDKMEKSQPLPDTVSDEIQDKKIDDRKFIYDISYSDPKGPVKRTIVSEEYPGTAYSIYGTTNLKVSDCIAMKEGSEKASCLASAAIYLSDISICKNSKADLDKASCYYKYSIKNADSKGCELIDKLDNKNLQPGYAESCKRQLAILTGDASLCVVNKEDFEADIKINLCREIASSKILVGKEECREELVSFILTESTHFGEAINWLRKEHTNEKVLSWWDYGRAMDCVGLKSAISNENLDDTKILEAAYIFVEGNETELVSFMGDSDSKYVLFDIETAGLNIGGKYHALNYLGCAWSNKTNSATAPGTSLCESEYLWETVYTPLVENPDDQCTISQRLNKTGVTVFYELTRDSNGNVIGLSSPAYCVGKTMLANGQESMATFYLDRKYENGDLKLNKALLLQDLSIRGANGDPVVQPFVLLYTKDPIWIENGEVKDGYEDRKGKYYDSNIYKAVFLKELSGFQLIYESSQRSQFGGHPKIYKLN